MSDVWDIAQYVEAHPDNHDQRWRLAKKLYMAWEYRLALEHLQVLENEWDKKISLSRYLAATYYRLSRYDDAIRELERAISKWPDELGLHEQLARTLDVAGRKPEAIKVWEIIAQQEPDHPFASRAVEHLRGEERTEQDAADPQVPAGIAAAGLMERSCPNCGAMNNPEFRRCWQCHASMLEAGEAEEEGQESSVAALVKENESPWGLAAGLTIAGLLALGAYLTLGAFAAEQPGALAGVPETLSEFLSGTLLMTRLIVGLCALIVWPILWRVSALFVGMHEIHNDVLYRCGAVLAGVTYAVSWVPGSLIYLIVLVPVVLSAALAFGALKAPPARALLLWVVQGTAMAIVVVALLAGRHGIGIVTDVPAMFRFASSGVTTSLLRETWTPLELGLKWESSGSNWLDENASTVRISVQTGPHSKQMFVEFWEGDQILAIDNFATESYAFNYSPIVPGKAYRLVLTGEEGIDAIVSVSGVLQIGPAVPE